MDIPIELFLGFTGISIVLAIFGFLRNPQIPATIVMGGMFILLISVATTNIILGNDIDSTTTVQLDSSIQNITYSYIVESATNTGAILRNDGAQNFLRTEYINNTSSALVGDRINCIDFPIRRTGSPPINQLIEVGIYRTNETAIQVFNTLNVTALTTASVWYTFCLPEGSVYTLQAGDGIGIKYKGNSVGNDVIHSVDDNNPFDSTLTYRRGMVTNPTWVQLTSGDLTMRAYLTQPFTETFEDFDYQYNLYEFTELPKTLFALIGVMIMLVGGLMVMRD